MEAWGLKFGDYLVLRDGLTDNVVFEQTVKMSLREWAKEEQERGQS